MCSTLSHARQQHKVLPASLLLVQVADWLNLWACEHDTTVGQQTFTCSKYTEAVAGTETAGKGRFWADHSLYHVAEQWPAWSHLRSVDEG